MRRQLCAQCSAPGSRLRALSWAPTPMLLSLLLLGKLPFACGLAALDQTCLTSPLIRCRCHWATLFFFILQSEPDRGLAHEHQHQAAAPFAAANCMRGCSVRAVEPAALCAGGGVCWITRRPLPRLQLKALHSVSNPQHSAQACCCRCAADVCRVSPQADAV